MKINAFCTVDPIKALGSCDRVIYCGESRFDDDGILCHRLFGSENSGDIYIPTLLDESFEDACDYVLTSGKRMIVRAAYDLNEAGLIEARYKLSPIMLLHRLGVLERCTVVGGVCLDNDDLDLMAQEGVPLVVTPTASAGYGYGFAPVCAAKKRGIRVGIGTFDGRYNESSDLNAEAKFLLLASNAEMRTENSLSELDIQSILEFK
ncbi:MAG: hypothetical protein J1F39_07230 [Clostridiales bacterium]|nr:hypothetical protein [Clostridiales bacterium]